jgi:transposase InsO family protein
MVKYGIWIRISVFPYSGEKVGSHKLGKHARTKMPKQTTHHASQILELVHSDVCGPFRVTSLGGNRYFVTFIDDYSKKIWIYFLSDKSQVFSRFQHFVQLMKTTTGKTIQTLRTDNGGEYTSIEFFDLCSSQGISRELPPPYAPERNGVAERRNWSLLDITRCLLIDSSLPGHLWGEAIKAAGDILNLRSTKKHPDKTPEELFTGKKPSISHLRVFGSPVFAHIPKVSRSKLAPRSEQCVLLSFDYATRAYKCYRPSTWKVFISRDLYIDETALSKSSTGSSPTQGVSTDQTPAPMATEDLCSRMDLPPQSILEAPVNDSPTQPTPVLSPTADLPVSPSPDISTHTDPVPRDSPTQLPPHLSPTNSPQDSGDSHPQPPPDRLRRSERLRRFPAHLRDFAAHVQLHPHELAPEDLTDNLTFKQANLDPQWRRAMQEEMDSIYNNHTWSLVPLPPDKRAITSRWVFKVKPGNGVNQTRFKARLVARGFEQTYGVDFLETFAPVVRWETIRILIAIATHLNWPIHQLDVLIAFLNGILKEDVYMLQPPGFIQPGTEHLVCKLHKSLYGLKHSPRAWYARLHVALLAWKLTQFDSDPNLYFSHTGTATIVLLVYVDDIILTGSNLNLINRLKGHLHTTFRTNDLGPIRRYLGVQFERDSTSVRMHQTEYAISILRQFKMEHCAPSATPLPEGITLSKESVSPPVDATLYRMLVGKLLFLTKTRPDITYAVNVVSRFMQNPQEAHLQAAKHILRYLRRHPDLGLSFQQGEENCLNGYTDADYGQDIDDRISVGAYIFFLGSSPISWNSKKQSSTSRSSCESEYRALAQCSCEAIWIRRLLNELRILDNKPTNIFCDNQSSIKLSYNPVFHERSKHFQIDYHFTRQKVEDNTLKVEFISS